nr:NADH dehydrogenase subunit 4L [Bangiopsis subsimplex]
MLLALVLLLVSLMALLIHRSALLMLVLSLEMAVVSCFSMLCWLSCSHAAVDGATMALVLLTVGAAEVALGLALVLLSVNVRGLISLEYALVLIG